MTAYWIMLIWVLIVGSVVKSNSRVLRTADNGIEFKFTLGQSWLIMLIPIIICALRSEFIDTYSYILEFIKSPALSEFKETINQYGSARLHYGIQILFKNLITSNAQIWIASITVFHSILLIRFINKYSTDSSFSFFLFIANGMILSWMCNGLKQFSAALVLVSFSYFLIEKKYSNYLLVVIFVSGIDAFFNILGIGICPWFLGGLHQSALIMIPIMFCVTGEILNRRMIAMMGVIFVILSFGLMDSFLGIATKNTAYSEDLQYVSADTGMNIFRFLVNAVPVILVLVKRKEIKSENSNNIVSLSVNMSFTSALIYLCGTYTSGIFIARLPIYCELYNLILYPWLFEHPYKREKVWLKPILYICYILYFFYQTLTFGESYGSNILRFLNP